MANTHNHVTQENNDNNNTNPSPPPTPEQVLLMQSLDVVNHATNYGENATSTRTTTSTIALVTRQAWRILVDQAFNVLSLHRANGCR
jgi:hypothetical protein